MARVELKDGSIVDIPIQPGWDEEAVQRAIREYKTAHAPPSDASETDPWGTYIDKEVKSVARGGGGGLASTADLAKNFILDAPANAVDWLRGDPTRRDLWDTPVRSAYERNVIAQPKGSDYETTANIAETVVPAIAETALTGSPKTALVRGPLSAGTGYVGGKIGKWGGELLGGEQGGELGELIGSLVAPASTTRTGAKIATAKTGLPLLTSLLNRVGLGRFDPYRLIPKTAPLDLAGRMGAGASSSNAADYGTEAAAEDERRRQQELYRQQTGR